MSNLKRMAMLKYEDHTQLKSSVRSEILVALSAGQGKNIKDQSEILAGFSPRLRRENHDKIN